MPPFYNLCLKKPFPCQKIEIYLNIHLILFVGGETLCYVIIAALFIFMKVEKYSKFDHEAIAEDQKEKCEKLNIPYISTEDRLAKTDAKKKVSEAKAKAKLEADEKSGKLQKAKEKEAVVKEEFLKIREATKEVREAALFQ